MEMKSGSNNDRLKQYGWVSGIMGEDNAGDFLPACGICRKNNVEWLKKEVSQRECVVVSCDKCANWKVNDATAAMLRQPVPKDYPDESISMPNPPEGVAAPLERAPKPHRLSPQEGVAVDEGETGEPVVDYLHPIDCTFKTQKDGTRFAFFNAMSPRNKGWNQVVTMSYLRTLGINEAQQRLIYVAAKKAFKEGQLIDWTDPYFVGQYRFPAAWVADLEVGSYIELLMHLLFLGIAASNFDLCGVYFVNLKSMVTFKKQSNNLLIALHGFNLSWLLAYPFGGTKLTTGAWVSENWLAWVRVSKICYSFCTQNGIDDERKGCNDVIRLVTHHSLHWYQESCHTRGPQSKILF
jgi:hypothetical protein